MVQAVVALGGNVGDVSRTFDRARTLVERNSHVQSIESAGLYRSEAMGADAGADFFNSAWVVETSLNPNSLLKLLQAVENESGRTRDVRWGPRTLDLDLIFYGEEQIQSARLTIPHPHCWYRRFVLAPVESLLPDLNHPVLGVPIRELSRRVAAKPFVLAVGGFEDAERAPLQGVVDEFSDIKLLNVSSPSDVDVSKVSLAIWLGECESDSLSALWLRIPDRPYRQALRDTLTAACTELQCIGTSYGA